MEVITPPREWANGRSLVSLQSVTLGTEPAELVLAGGSLLSTTRRTLIDGALAIADGQIAGIFEDPEPIVGPETRVLDVSGSVVTPGFVDAHTHLDLHQAFDLAYPRALAGGTTAAVSEVAAFGPAFGPDGVEIFLESTADLPVRVFAAVPPQPFFDMFETPRGTEDEHDRLVSLLAADRVVGVGETAWIRLVGRECGAKPLQDRARRMGLTVSGHGAGVAGERLQAFGIEVTDDHEAISASGIRDRVAAGIHAIGRYGSIRDDMDALVSAAEDLDASELSLSTDGMWPRELASEGYMDAVLRRVIDGGVDPIEAVTMATLTPARHFGLDGLGTLTPGSHADVVVLDDLESVSVRTTIVAGEVVYDAASEPPDPSGYDYPDRFTGLPELEFELADFTVLAPADDGSEIRAIEYDGGLLSGQTTVEPAVDGGELLADPDSDVLKVALFDRHPDGDRGGFTGFVRGFGLDGGAVATTLTWENAGLLVMGADEEEMVTAANRVVELDGGWAVVEDGATVAELPTPIGAMCAATPPETTAVRYDAVEEAVFDLGADVERPLLGLQTLSFFGVPSLKMAFDGYADIRRGEIVGLRPD